MKNSFLKESTEKLNLQLLLIKKEYPREWFKGHAFALHSLLLPSYTQKIVSDIGFDLSDLLKKDEYLSQLVKTFPCHLEKPIEFTASKYTVCGICGEPYCVSFDGEDFTILNECKFPNGMVVIADIPFPSGKIVVENDVRELFPNVDQDRNINIIIENALTGLDYAKSGCAHFFVGNCCPGVFQFGKDKLVVANPDDVRNTVTVDGHRYKQVASICTDLWWYSMTDYDNWVKRAGKEPGRYQEIIAVKPGLYRFTHFRHTYDCIAAYGDEKQLVYTKIERVKNKKPFYKILPA